jgi:hypothetical protein
VVDLQDRLPAQKLTRESASIVPIAVEAAVAVMIAAAVVPARFGQAEHALDRAHGPADTGADRASDHATHGPGDPVTFVGSLLGTTDDALGMAERGMASSASAMASAAKMNGSVQPPGRAAVLTLVFLISIS